MSTLAPSRVARDLHRAWVAVAFIPVFFVLAFAAGEGLYAALGYDPSTGTEPAWVLLLVALVALPVFLVPCAAAVFYGQRARRGGDRRALVPYLIGGVVGLWFVILNLVTVVSDLVR